MPNKLFPLHVEPVLLIFVYYLIFLCQLNENWVFIVVLDMAKTCRCLFFSPVADGELDFEKVNGCSLKIELRTYNS